MSARAVAITSEGSGRIAYGYYETLSTGGGSCQMCSAALRPNIPHACSKPDFDQPAHEVPARGTTLLYSPGGHHA